MPGSRRARLAPLAALVLVIAVTFGVWWASSNSRHGALPTSPPDDDLPSIPRPRDSESDADDGRPPARDVLVAGPDRLYLSRAHDRSIVAFAKTGGAGVPIAHVDGPVYGMAFADATLWMTTSLAATAQRPPGALLRLAVGEASPVVAADGLVSPRALATDGQWVFVVDVDSASGTSGLLPESAIVRISTHPPAGSRPEVIAWSKGEVSNVAVDESFVYWADRLEAAIVAMPKAGGERRVLVRTRGLPGDVILDTNALYWVEEQSGSLWSLPKGGGAPRQMALDFAGFAGLVSDLRSLAWTNAVAVEGAFQVLTMPKTGGEPSVATAAGTSKTMGALASDGAHIYWERDGKVVQITQ